MDHDEIAASASLEISLHISMEIKPQNKHLQRMCVYVHVCERESVSV